MPSVTINSGELPTARGKSGYDLERVIARWQQIADGRFEDDCRFLLQMIDETDELELWKHGANGFYKTRDEFLQKCVLIDFDLTEQSFAEIVGRLRQGERVPLARHGANQHTRGDSNTMSSNGRGADYDLRRLMRDRPDLVERIDAGELSPHAAAIVAGFNQRTISIRTEDPASAARSIVKNFSDENAAAIADEINRLRKGEPT